MFNTFGVKTSRNECFAAVGRGSHSNRLARRGLPGASPSIGWSGDTVYLNVLELPAGFQFPDLKASEHYYDLARQCYEYDGRVLVNASTSTHLDVFPLIQLEQFIRDA